MQRPTLASTHLIASVASTPASSRAPPFWHYSSPGWSSWVHSLSHLKRVLVSLFSTAAKVRASSAYTGQFYAMFFLQVILRINSGAANIVETVALAMGMPSLIVFGPFSDKIGRKKIMMAGFLLAVLTYIPIYHAMESAAGNHVVTVKSTRDKVSGAITLTPMTTDTTGALIAAKEAANPSYGKLTLLIFIQNIYVGIVYGPIAAYLVEAFPAKIRYTSLSLPYHIGNGIFGWIAAAYRAIDLRGNRQPIRWPLLPNGCGRGLFPCWQLHVARDLWHENLG